MLPTESSIYKERHIQGDVREILGDGWDLMIAHPPCTYLSRAGGRWLYPKGELDEERHRKGLEAKEFFMQLLEAPIKHIAIENPTPFRIFELPKHVQVIQPYMFGHPFSKRSLLWLKGLTPLKATDTLNDFTPYLPSNTGGKKRGQKHKIHGAAMGKKNRSRTFPGIAAAMADQWGNVREEICHGM